MSIPPHLPAFPAVARPIRHDLAPGWKRRVREDDCRVARNRFGEQALARGAHGDRITARGDPIKVRDLTSMVEQIPNDGAGLGAALDAHHAVAR